MKYLYILVVLAFGTYQARSQTLFFENDGFETWDSTQGYLNPANWHSLNVLSGFGLPLTLERTTDAHSGNFGVMLTSKDFSSGTLSGVLATGPIIDAFGNPNINGAKVAYAYRPSKFSFYYHADPELTDTCIITLVLTKWNLAQQRSDTVGGAFLMVGDSTAQYQFADLTIQYDLPFMPDSMFIIASSSLDGFNPTAGSKLFLDDFKITGGSTGIASSSKKEMPIQIWPTPGNNMMHLEVPQQAGELNVYDTQGKLVYKKTITDRMVNINTSEWPVGLYLVNTLIHDKVFTAHWVKQ